MKVILFLTIIIYTGILILSPKLINYAKESNFRQTIYPITECNDGIDNDGDGGIDFAFDLQCSSWEDPSESPNASYPVSNPVINPTITTPTSPTPLVIQNLVQISQDIQQQEVQKEVNKIVQQYFWKPLGQVLSANEITQDLQDNSAVNNYIASTFFTALGYLMALGLLSLYLEYKKNEFKK